MANFETFKDCLNEIINRYENEEKVRKPLKNFGQKSLIITCVKEDHSFMIKVNNDQGIEVKDNIKDESAPIQIHFIDEQVLFDLFNKELGPIKAYSSGKIKIIKGDNRLLLKLRKLLF